MKTTITLNIDTADLSNLEDSQIHALWHVSQLNPAPMGDKDAGLLVRDLTEEIVSRWLKLAPAELHAHGVRDHQWSTLQRHGTWNGPDGTWLPHAVSPIAPAGTPPTVEVLTTTDSAPAKPFSMTTAKEA